MIELLYGPDAPPMIEQLGLDAAEMGREDLNAIVLAQIALNAISEVVADGGDMEEARRRRQAITERLAARFLPGDVVHGQAHYDAAGTFLEGDGDGPGKAS